MVTVTGVVPHSPAEKAGIYAGDCLQKINGHDINDVFDYRFYQLEKTLKVTLCRDGQAMEALLYKGEYEDPGLLFKTALMDEAHRCQNGCVFCFIDQLPKGMRPSLYFKDDDTRLSFLHGNYITLTNLTDRDVDRITEMHMSPVNVSVHTTDPALRVKMMRNKRAGEVLSYLRRFADAGLTLRAQIVLCKGINDGEALLSSIRDLGAYFPALDSVSVVPVGLTEHREGLPPLLPFEKEDALAIIKAVDGFGDEFYRKNGSRLVFCADEWYLKAEKPLPPESYYEGYPQIENGVGMLRSLIEEATVYLSNLSANVTLPSRTVSVATGEAAAPTLQKLADALTKKCPSLSVRIFAVQNDFFGHQITVSGLLTGRDIIAQLQNKELGDELLIPKNALRAGEDVLLDDLTVGDISHSLGGIPVHPVEDDGQAFLCALLGKS